MNRVRYLAASLLCLTGVMHVARLGIPASDAAMATTAILFGVTYLAVGALLFLDWRTAYYLGAIAPGVGLCVGLLGGMAGIPEKPSAWMAVLALVDAVIVLSCVYLIKGKRST